MVKVEGHGLSKSRGFVIDIDEDFIQNGIDLDTVRYYILSYTGFTKDLDFVWKDFQTKVNNELVGILGNYAYRVLLFIHKNFEKPPKGVITPKIKEQISKALQEIQKAINNFRFKEAVDSTIQLATQGNVFFQQSEPWKSIKENPNQCQKDLFQCLQLLKAIAILIEPVIPQVAEQLWQQLGQRGIVHEIKIEECLKPFTTKNSLPKPKVLFEKLPDETIAKMSSILNNRTESAREKTR